MLGMSIGLGSKIKGGFNKLGGFINAKRTERRQKKLIRKAQEKAEERAQQIYKSPVASGKLGGFFNSQARFQNQQVKLQNRTERLRYKLEKKEAKSQVRSYRIHQIIKYGTVISVISIIIIVGLTLAGLGAVFSGVPVLSVIPYTMGSLGFDISDVETGTKQAGGGIRSILPTDFWTGIDIMSGKTDPSTLWESKTIRDNYVAQGADKAGIEITKFRPLRNPFYLDGESTEAYVTGNLKINAFPGSSTVALISANSNSGDWTCDPSTLTVEEMYGRTFLCNKVISGSESVTLTLQYNHISKSGINLYAVEGEELSDIYQQEKNPLSYYGISSKELSSWTIPEKPVGLAIGSAEDLLPVYKNSGLNIFVVGITIRNNGAGMLKTIDDFYIIVSPGLKNTPQSDFTSTGGNKYVLKSNIPVNEDLSPGQGQTFNYVFEISPSELQDKILREFTIEATSECTYIYEAYTSVQVESLNP